MEQLFVSSSEDQLHQDRSYQVMARRYRPQCFSEVVGQDAFVTLIQNALRSKRVPHSLLLTGVRGIGKTTLARLIAKALNCATLIGVEPCNACTSCVALAQERHMDVVEIDAASNTGVDDIRPLIETCSYHTVMGNYRIYIIDEAHMLSKNAFNALLKTIEEPPAHVCFILATTEVNKIPVTIASRCLKLPLRRVPTDVLVGHLKTVCMKEGILYEDGALDVVARCADGSVRDALSLLEQVVLGLEPGGSLGVCAVRDMLGMGDRRAIWEIVRAIIKGEKGVALDRLRTSYRCGADPILVLEEFSLLLHSLALHGTDSVALEGIAADEIGELSANTSLAHVGRLWKMAQKGIREVRESSLQMITLEMIVMQMAHMGVFPTPEALLACLRTEGRAQDMSGVARVPITIKEREPRHALIEKAEQLFRGISIEEVRAG